MTLCTFLLAAWTLRSLTFLGPAPRAAAGSQLPAVAGAVPLAVLMTPGEAMAAEAWLHRCFLGFFAFLWDVHGCFWLFCFELAHSVQC